MQKTLALLSFAFLAACASKMTSSTGLELMTESKYKSIVDTYTGRSQQYSGLYNTIDLSATLMNSAVTHAQNDQKARLLQWDAAQYASNQGKSRTEMMDRTVVFLSFYTPDRKNDDLQKNNTQWRIYLEADGKRWEPKVVKLRQPVSELQSLYAYHTKFSTAYQLTFPVATTTVERTRSKLIVTGPLGFGAIEYKPVDPTLVRE